MDVSDTSSTPTSSDPDENDLVLELLCHAHIGVFMEALLDEEDTCNKDEVHRLEGHSNRYHSRHSDPLA